MASRAGALYNSKSRERHLVAWAAGAVITPASARVTLGGVSARARSNYVAARSYAWTSDGKMNSGPYLNMPTGAPFWIAMNVAP